MGVDRDVGHRGEAAMVRSVAAVRPERHSQRQHHSPLPPLRRRLSLATGIRHLLQIPSLYQPSSPIPSDNHQSTNPQQRRLSGDTLLVHHNIGLVMCIYRTARLREASNSAAITGPFALLPPRREPQLPMGYRHPVGCPAGPPVEAG